MKINELIRKLSYFAMRNGNFTVKIRDEKDCLRDIELVSLSARSDEEDFVYSLWISKERQD